MPASGRRYGKLATSPPQAALTSGLQSIKILRLPKYKNILLRGLLWQ